MAFTKIWPAGVSAGQVLTHTEFTALDLDHENSVDKTGDTVTGGMTFSSQVDMDGALSVNDAAAFTATSATVVQSGATWAVQSGATFDFQNGSTSKSTGTFLITGANGKLQTASSGRVKLNDSDWVELNSRTVSRYFPFANVVVPTGTSNWTANIDGLQSGAAGAQIRFSMPWWLQDGATLATVDLFVFPAPGAHGTSTAHSVTIYKRTVAAGAGVPSWTSIGSASISAAGWGDGNVKSVAVTVGSVISAGDQIAIDIYDETAGTGTYPVTGVYNLYLGATLHYTMTEHRPA